jgi:cysteine desulfuration protein SufE
MPWNPEQYVVKPKPKVIHTRKFSCADDHPIVWYTFDDNDKAMCEYCSTHFVYEAKDFYADLLNEMDEMIDRYTWLMDFGKNSAIVPERFKLKEFEVPGCQSQTWLVPHFTYEDTIYFTADSAALISKGMVCMLADVFSNSTRSDIASFELKELNGLNLDNLLTPGRRNGVYSMLKVIQGYGSRKD